MSAERKPRDKYTHYENAEPVKDPYELMDLFSQGRSDSTDGRYLHVSGGNDIELHRGWYTHGDSGGDRSGIDYYCVDQDTAQKLIKEGWVTPKRVPQWGHTETRHNQLVLSDAGKAELRRFHEEQRNAALALLVPGKHSKFSGVFNYRSHGRQYPGLGPLYIDFITPMDEKVRVYPTLKKVEKVK